MLLKHFTVSSLGAYSIIIILIYTLLLVVALEALKGVFIGDVDEDYYQNDIKP